MASSNVAAARRALERDLKRAIGEVERLKVAVRALSALDNPHSTGMRLPSKLKTRVCVTQGCGTSFAARRKDARFCSSCRVARRDSRDRTEKGREKAAQAAVRDRKKGVTIVKNTPSKR